MAIRTEGTLEEIVNRMLTMAKGLETRAAKGEAENGDVARLAFAASRLHAQAIAALRARSTVGDFLTRPGAQRPKDAPALPAPESAPVESDAMEALKSGLDS